MIKDFKKARERMNDLLKGVDHTSVNVKQSIISQLAAENHNPRNSQVNKSIGFWNAVDFNEATRNNYSSCFNGSCTTRMRPDQNKDDASSSAGDIDDSSLESVETLSL